MKKERERKVRNDKKTDVKPTVSIEIKDAIYRLSYITKIPVMYVSESFFLYAIGNTGIRTNVSQYFQRGVVINGTLYNGSLSNPVITKRTHQGVSERIHLRISQTSADTLAAFAYALNCSKSKACAILIEEAMNDVDYINRYVQQHLERNLDKNRMAELRTFMRFIHKENDDQDSWAALLSYIVDEVKKPMESAKELVEEFIIHHWK